MDVGILQLLVTGLGSAGLKPAWDYLSGRTAAKRATEEHLWDRIKALEVSLALNGAELSAAKEAMHVMQINHERERSGMTRALQAVREEMADVQATNEQMAADLAITNEHVALLRDQLEAAGQVPTPRPPQPRGENGQFLKQKRKK